MLISGSGIDILIRIARAGYKTAVIEFMNLEMMRASL